MSVTHLKSNIVADFTGTVTVHNSQGSTTTVAASDLVRPSDWNSAHAQLWTLTGNTTQNSTASGTNIILAASGGGVSVGGSNGSLVVSGPVLNGYNPHQGAESVAGQQGAGTLYLQPFALPAAVAYDRLIFPVVFSNTNNSSNSYTWSQSHGLYTKTGSTLSLVSSGSTSYAQTASGIAGNYSLWGGARNVTVGATDTLQPGNYWLGVWSRTTTGGGAGQTLNQMLASQPNSTYSGILGAASNATDQPMLGMGRYSVSFSTAMPSSVALSHIQGNSSILQRAPLFFFASGTA